MNAMPRPTPVTPWTWGLLAALAIGYAAQLTLGNVEVMTRYALWPLPPQIVSVDGALLEVGFQPWQLVTYGFLHGSPTHLLFNALALWMFGRPVEQAFGSKRFGSYWFVCVIGAAVAQIVAQRMAGENVPTVGASGGVFGLLFAFAVLYPKARIVLLFPPIPMPAWLFAIGYGLIELYLGISGKQAQVAHFAHLGGAVAGIPLALYWLGQLRSGRRFDA